MDLKPTFWPLDPVPDALASDFADPASHAADEQEPCDTRRLVPRHGSRDEERHYVMARLQAIGLNVGRR